MPKVCIVGHDSGILNMFLRRGWTVVDNIDEQTDLIQFTGGEDVDPSYYNEPRHPATRSNPSRDAYEASVYNSWKHLVPMAGICRGGQFLNVMNGGSLWQHVTGHAVAKGHVATCLENNEAIMVTSTHHQMMRLGPMAEPLMVAQVSGVKHTHDEVFDGSVDTDLEAVFYPETSSLCFQPHPEYVSINSPLQDKYFEYINRYILDK